MTQLLVVACWVIMLAGTATVVIVGDVIASVACALLLAAAVSQWVMVRREMRQREARLRQREAR